MNVFDRFRTWRHTQQPTPDSRYLRQPVYPDDTYIVSYPKSGNTWFRFILSNLLRSSADERIDFHAACRYVPDIEVHLEELAALSRPRFIKSHSPQLIREYPRVVYLVRDPRDVYVSYFYYLRKKLPEDLSLSDFVRELPKTIGEWHDHVSDWQNHSNALTIRYEDLHADPVAAITNALAFCDLQDAFSDSWIRAAIDCSSFKEMQNAEQHSGLPVRNGSQSSVAERFMRKGVSGDWQTELTPDDVSHIEVREGRMMRQFGYLNPQVHQDG